MKHLMRFKANIFVFSLCSVILMSACSLLSSDNLETIEGAQFIVSIDETEVSPGGHFTATYVVKNMTNKKLEIITSCPLIAFFGVYQNDEHMDFYGTGIGCIAINRKFEIPPMKSIKFDWEINAFTVRREPEQASYDTTFASPGDYTLRFNSNVVEINGRSVQLDDEIVHFRVK
jgi:hypothetical protein